MKTKIKGKTYEERYGIDTARRMREQKSIRMAGKNHPLFGTHPSKETTRKRVETRTNNNSYKHDDIWKKKFSLIAKEKGFGKWMTGRKMSESNKIKISEAVKGKPSKLRGRKLSEEHKKRIKENNCRYWLGKSGDERISGENSNNWKGGISFGLYGKEFNNKLKNEIRKRDNQICMNCGIHREKLKEALSIHHINYIEECNLQQNLISLCRSCHIHTNFNKEYWTKLFQDKLSKLYNYKYSEDNIILNLNEVNNEVSNSVC